MCKVAQQQSRTPWLCFRAVCGHRSGGSACSAARVDEAHRQGPDLGLDPCAYSAGNRDPVLGCFTGAAAAGGGVRIPWQEDGNARAAADSSITQFPSDRIEQQFLLIFK